MRLFLIRHGQSTNNALEDFSLRTVDPQLSELGKTQATHLAEFIASHQPHFNFTHLYASAMFRALATAQPLAQALNLPIDVWVDVHEFGGMYLENVDNGDVEGFSGLTRREIHQAFPEAVLNEDITHDGWYPPQMKRESLPHFMMRAVRVLHALKARAHTDDRIAIVSHGLFLDGLMKAIFHQLPTPPNQIFYLFNNTGITRIDFSEPTEDFEDLLRIQYHNRLDHLPFDLHSD